MATAANFIPSALKMVITWGLKNSTAKLFPNSIFILRVLLIITFSHPKVLSFKDRDKFCFIFFYREKMDFIILYSGRNSHLLFLCMG